MRKDHLHQKNHHHKVDIKWGPLFLNYWKVCRSIKLNLIKVSLDLSNKWRIWRRICSKPRDYHVINGHCSWGEKQMTDKLRIKLMSITWQHPFPRKCCDYMLHHQSNIIHCLCSNIIYNLTWIFSSSLKIKGGLHANRISFSCYVMSWLRMP